MSEQNSPNQKNQPDGRHVFKHSNQHPAKKAFLKTHDEGQARRAAAHSLLPTSHSGLQTKLSVVTQRPAAPHYRLPTRPTRLQLALLNYYAEQVRGKGEILVQRQSSKSIIQRVSLHDYADHDPQHDPSRLSDTQIQATDEYRFMSTYTVPPSTQPYATPAEALLAARLLLRAIRERYWLSPLTEEARAREFINRAKRQLGTLRSAVGQVGHLNWVPFSTGAAVQNPSALPTEFGRWVLAGGPEPNALTGSVNCWEMVLFGAYKAGYLSFSRIQQIYNRAVQRVRSGETSLVGDTVEAMLRRGDENIFDLSSPDSPEPLAGDIVIFNRAAVHVAIALGTRNSAGEHEVLSLWNQPNNTSQVQRTTIEAILAVAGAGARPVKFWGAAW